MSKLIIYGMTCSYCNGDLCHALGNWDGLPRDERSGDEDFYTCNECGKAVEVESIHMSLKDVTDPEHLEQARAHFAVIKNALPDFTTEDEQD